MNQKPLSADSAASSDAAEIAGPGGIAMTGGDLTPPQNAGEKLETAMEDRKGEQRMERRQLAGQVEQQNQARNPSATDPDGMPDAVSGDAANHKSDTDSK